MLEPEIGFPVGGKLNFHQSFLQFNVKNIYIYICEELLQKNILNLTGSTEC